MGSRRHVAIPISLHRVAIPMSRRFIPEITPKGLRALCTRSLTSFVSKMRWTRVSFFSDGGVHLEMVPETSSRLIFLFQRLGIPGEPRRKDA
mmetsp:Transcript_8012/g.20801  ORF Transcript_8012/g.20801 Transcript_8012/m.20801 type:complete len:92 (+) Transcript_8012:156-431(+)